MDCSGLFLKSAALAFLGDFCEEVVALVVNEYECGEILDFYFPNSLHAELGIFEKLNFLDAVLSKDSCRRWIRDRIRHAYDTRR